MPAKKEASARASENGREDHERSTFPRPRSVSGSRSGGELVSNAKSPKIPPEGLGKTSSRLSARNGLKRSLTPRIDSIFVYSSCFAFANPHRVSGFFSAVAVDDSSAEKPSEVMPRNRI